MRFLIIFVGSLTVGCGPAFEAGMDTSTDDSGTVVDAHKNAAKDAGNTLDAGGNADVLDAGVADLGVIPDADVVDAPQEAYIDAPQETAAQDVATDVCVPSNDSCAAHQYKCGTLDLGCGQSEVCGDPYIRDSRFDWPKPDACPKDKPYSWVCGDIFGAGPSADCVSVQDNPKSGIWCCPNK